MRTFHLTTAVILVALVARPNVVRAQNAGALANVSVGAASGDQVSGIAFSGGVGYRFNRSIGFGIELTHLPSLESDFPRIATPIYYPGPIEDDNAEGNATFFTTNVRVEIPTTMRRVIPYVVGGGGMASLTQGTSVIYYALSASGSVSSSASSAAIAYPIPNPGILPRPSVFLNTTTAMALTLGGGTSILVTDHLAVDVDLRAFRLLGETGRTMGRFGVGASYRF